VILSGVVNSIHQGGMRREKQNERRRHNARVEYPGTKEDSGAISADSASTAGGSSQDFFSERFFRTFFCFVVTKRRAEKGGRL
jgi:hypothetical protein